MNAGNQFSKAVMVLAAGSMVLLLAIQSGGQQSGQEPSFTPLTTVPVAVQGGEIGDMLRKWYSDGTAAGNAGDYYDNRDGAHSPLNLDPYPQVRKVEYTEEQQKARAHWGMQKKILPFVVFGNSSTAASPQQGGSIPRSYYSTPGGLEFLFAQYVRNNMYVYPEHLDHDAGHNGTGGFGDLFPTNTPYLITSQGSSGSDQAFLRALPYVLAAFRPEVKRKLVQTGILMPVVQMILRTTSKGLDGSKDYLSGKAHPAVFQGGQVDAVRMVEMAHKIELSNIPPVALIRAVQEDERKKGIDYFEPELTEKLADTPAVIARIFRASAYSRKIVVSAEDSKDLNRRPLKFYWAVLRGDPDKIKIDYRNPSRSVAEITISYHGRSPVAAGALLESNRVDIGVFVHNGAYYSPPAFVTFYTLDNEARTYRSDGRPLEIGYGTGTSILSIADWKKFFDAMTSPAESWPFEFLRKQFRPEELEALSGFAGEFRSVHATLLAAQDLATRAAAALKQAGSSPEAKKRIAADLTAAQRGVSDARKSEQQLLDRQLSSIKSNAPALVQRVLDSLLRDPALWESNTAVLERLCASADKKAQEAVAQIKKKLLLLRVAESPDGASFRWSPIAKELSMPAERFTRFEESLVEQLNATVLSRILLPGIVAGEWRENYVDARIASDKGWRDVYRYAPDGSPMGWTRYGSEGNSEFHADGYLILEKDSQGRCIRARAVRYELEPQKRDGSGRVIGPHLRKVKMIPGEFIREYEYMGTGDWKGRAKQGKFALDFRGSSSITSIGGDN